MGNADQLWHAKWYDKIKHIGIEQKLDGKYLPQAKDAMKFFNLLMMKP